MGAQAKMRNAKPRCKIVYNRISASEAKPPPRRLTPLQIPKTTTRAVQLCRPFLALHEAHPRILVYTIPPKMHPASPRLISAYPPAPLPRCVP